MAGSPSNANTAGQALTDGTGVSPLTFTKYVKDFIADFLMTAAAAVTTIPLASAFGVPTTDAEFQIVAVAVLGALIRAGYRTVLRWATTP